MDTGRLRGVLNDAVAIHFADAALAGAFVARWCLGYRVAPVEGAYRVREDAPTARLPLRPPKMP